MSGDEQHGGISQLTGMMGFIHRSGALAPFQVMMIITGVIFTLSTFVRDSAFGQPLCLWIVCIFAIEVISTLFIGGILAWRRPDCLLSEMYQQTIKEMDAAQKGATPLVDNGENEDSSDESDDRSAEG